MGKKVLIADKSLYNRMVLRDILITHGFSVVEAATSEAAIELFKQSQPDLVTVDATMHNIDGTSPIRDIMLMDPHARVMLCGTRGQRRLVVEAMAMGAEGVLLKPFNERQVVRAIHEASGAPPSSGPIQM